MFDAARSAELDSVWWCIDNGHRSVKLKPVAGVEKVENRFEVL